MHNICGSYLHHHSKTDSSNSTLTYCFHHRIRTDIVLYFHQKGYVFGLSLVFLLSDFPLDYLQSNKRICIKSLPEVCLETKNIRLDFGNDLNCDLDPNYDPDLIWITQMYMKLWSKVCLWPRTYPLNCADDPDYNRNLD